MANLRGIPPAALLALKKVTKVAKPTATEVDVSIDDLGSPPSEYFVLSEDGKISSGKKTKKFIGVGIKSSGRTSFGQVSSIDQGGSLATTFTTRLRR